MKTITARMTKINFLLLVTILLVQPLSACSSLSLANPTPTLAPMAKEIVFYNWEEDMPEEILDAFYQEFGVQVRYETYLAQEDAIEDMRSGQVYDVVVFDNRFIPPLIEEGLLAKLNMQHISNVKNISATFRSLPYDPTGQYSVPYNWGTTGLVVRRDRVNRPISKWADLWTPHLNGKVLLWKTAPRDTIGIALKSLGYSVNSENSEELEQALERLIALKPNALFIEDIDADLISSAPLLAEEYGVIAMGYAFDIYATRELGVEKADYILPEEGPLLWGDNFVIPANSPNKYTAEVFIDFLLRPEIGALITNLNHYPTPNDAAQKYINADILNDPVIFPPRESLEGAEIIMPLSPRGEALHQEIWERFLEAP